MDYITGKFCTERIHQNLGFEVSGMSDGKSRIQEIRVFMEVTVGWREIFLLSVSITLCSTFHLFTQLLYQHLCFECEGLKVMRKGSIRKGGWNAFQWTVRVNRRKFTSMSGYNVFVFEFYFVLFFVIDMQIDEIGDD